MPKEKIVKNVGELKQKARKFKDDASKTVETVKTVVQAGVSTSKTVIEKAGDVLNKKNIGQVTEKASKGVDLVAKGARLASRGAETLASSLEKASEKIKNATNKMK